MGVKKYPRAGEHKVFFDQTLPAPTWAVIDFRPNAPSMAKKHLWSVVYQGDVSGFTL